jgi:hypothetical protein
VPVIRHSLFVVHLFVSRYLLLIVHLFCSLFDYLFVSLSLNFACFVVVQKGKNNSDPELCSGISIL